MPIIALQGIHGGIGTTSITAALAWALQELNQSVLAIDFSPDNLLRLYFNMPFEQSQGWACNPGKLWQDTILSYTSLLDFLPFGTIATEQQVQLTTELKNTPHFCRGCLSQLLAVTNYNWILLDLPAGDSPFAQQGLLLTDHIFLIINPDTNCHVRLHQQKSPRHCHFLINKYVPLSPLQQDLTELWQQTLDRLLPTVIHHDEAFAETLAVKQPLGKYKPHSLAAEDILNLANWSHINIREQAL